MRRLTGYIKIIVLISVCILIAIGATIYIRKDRKEDTSLKQTQYADAASVGKAMLQLEKEDCKKAEVISDVKTSEKIVALTFQGLADTQTNKEIRKLLNIYHRKASFFVPGITAAEDAEVIKALYKDGNKIESNSLKETKHMEKASNQELVKDFCDTNSIIGSIIKATPEVLLCNSSKYTPELLKAAYASGNRKVIKSTHYLNYQSFKNYSQVQAYVNSLKEGSILTFKMKGVLDKDEYEPAVRNAKPAIDKAPDINIGKNKKDNSKSMTEEEKLLSVVTWVLKALDNTKYKTVFAENLESHHDADFDIKFDDLRKQNHGTLAKVYKSVRTKKNIIAFSFRGINNKEKLNEILDFLEFNHIKATFFVTADDIIDYPDRIKTIINKNQNVANGGMTGKDLTSMDFNDICLEIYKCDKLLMEKYFIRSNIFMPAYGRYNDLVLEAASALGYHVITYNKLPITSATASLDDIMDRYKNGFKNGDIIYYNISLHKQILNILTQTYAFYIKNIYSIYDVPTLINRAENIHSSKLAENIYRNTNNDKVSCLADYAYDKAKPMRLLAYKTGNTIVSHTISKSIVSNKQKSVKSYAISSKSQLNKVKKPVYSKKEMNALRKKNKGKKAEVINTVYTTEQALGFTFYGVSNKTVTDDVLEKLDILNAKGTFFVTEKDIRNNAAEIQKIADKGHEIGICLILPEGTDFYSVCSSILTIQSQVKKLCGKNPTLVRYAYYVNMTNEMLEAVSSTGCKVAWQDLALASSKLGLNATLDDVIKYAFNNGNIVVKRGSIIYFRMDYYTDPALVGDLMLNIAKDRIDTITYYDGIANNGSSYSIKTLDSLLSSDKVYSYPVPGDKIIGSVKDAISPGHFQTMDTEEQFNYMKGHYVGNPDADTVTTLPGFDDLQIGKLNQTGRFTDDKVLFLTFDDWGSDKPINQLLYVLNKYGVKATFFVRTSYVQDNPNLLRAIAEAGHAVGCHTDKHQSFADSKIGDEFDISADFTSLTSDEVSERKSDLLLSYNKLQSIIGDEEVNGIPSLARILRPPTLAMSKEGMESIFDMGFQYIVSGDYSTHDYAETDPFVLADHIVNGLKHNDGSIQQLTNGSIIVLHMSDDNVTPTQASDVTAHALDIAIPKLQALGYRFAKLNDYLSDSGGTVY